MAGPLNTLRSRFAPDEVLPSIHDLSVERLRTQGITALVFDLDNTLGGWGFRALRPEVDRTLRTLRAAFRIGFLSNHAGEGRSALRDAFGDAPLIWGAQKPRRGGFRQILHALDALPHQTAMVGDRLVFDVWGAKRLGLFTVLVEPIIEHPGEGLSLRLQRRMERGLLQLHRWVRRPNGAVRR